jgi:bifunctional non-homologous end joining protein LigD
VAANAYGSRIEPSNAGLHTNVELSDAESDLEREFEIRFGAISVRLQVAEEPDEMSLSQYRKMRNFDQTREPSGKKRVKVGNSYVIQKHDASHLHYDLRLELNGVLLSWAVPKGPTLDPSVKRLAMQTEDHPVEYGGFEGTIPKGAYGGGTVMVWDRGTWEPEGDAQSAYEKGHLTFQLRGQKLTGGWHLVRTQRPGQKQKTWLLFKSRDDAAKPGDTSLLEEQRKSALSGRDLPAIAKGDKVWSSSSGKARKSKHTKRKTASVKHAAKSEKMPERTNRSAVSAGVKAALPTKIEPELATLVAETPSGADFVHEVKFDGYRVLARIDEGNVQLLTRNGEDWTERMPAVKATLVKLKVENAILDGEFVALDKGGASDFQLLQNSFSGKNDTPLAYYAFDLLHLNGFDIRSEPLLTRKAQLKELFAALPRSAKTMLRYSDHVLGKGAEFFAQAAKLGLEGVVSKRANSTYRVGRSKDWLKSKSRARQEFVIVGYSEPGGSRAHLGALLLGVRSNEALVYSGKVGTGFNERSLKDLYERLAPLEITRATLENAPRGADARAVHWVKPVLVAEVAYAGVTQDGLLRHPTFKGLREDKPARDIVLEQARASASKRKPKTARAESSSVARTRTTKTARTAATSSKSTAPSSLAPLSHPDKILYPELGLTKRELSEYYDVVSELMLPHVVDRAVTLLRCPEGRGKPCFFQKHPGQSLGEGLRRIAVPSSDGAAEYAAIEDARGLQSLVQMGALELHIGGSLADDAEHPDRLVFDLDPDVGLDFKDVIAGARSLRALLEEYGLQSWLKTTGGKGLHVTVPIAPKADWDTVKEFCRGVAGELTRREPDRYLATMSKAKRQGKIFVDYLRNGRGATSVAPYSARAREGATVAMPVDWSDLTAKFKPSAFTVRSAAKYLERRARDPFAALLACHQSLPSVPPGGKRGTRRK